MLNFFKKKVETPFGLGALESKEDYRTVQYSELSLGGTPLVKGGYKYTPEQVFYQAKVGICTAISLTQLMSYRTGKVFSEDFQYLLQKKYVDFNWQEGSSPLSSLKVGNKYGFLPAHEWTWTTQADHEMPYAQYVAKLKAIPELEIQRLLKLCTDKLPGYAQIDVNDPQATARAIENCKGGIICRFEIGSEWWIPSWAEKDISPLKKPKKPVSGHQIIKCAYDTTAYDTVVNTWSKRWCRNGSAEIEYLPTEAWAIVDRELFVRDLKVGTTHADVRRLQVFLNEKGYTVSQTGAGSPGNETDFFGALTEKALMRFQEDNGIPSYGYFGKITRGFINNL